MRPKALVVDDDTEVRETLAEQLSMHGFEVLTAGTASKRSST
jgi:DNA-binding response OmpR family regulator